MEETERKSKKAALAVLMKVLVVVGVAGLGWLAVGAACNASFIICTGGDVVATEVATETIQAPPAFRPTQSAATESVAAPSEEPSIAPTVSPTPTVIDKDDVVDDSELAFTGAAEAPALALAVVLLALGALLLRRVST